MTRPVAILGCAAAPPEGARWEGEVCAVFERSAHVRLDGRYLTLGDPSLAPHPCNILWERYAAAKLGMACAVSSRGLVLENGEHLDFNAARRFTPVMRCRDIAPARRILDALEATAAKALGFSSDDDFFTLIARPERASRRNASSIAVAMRLREERLFEAVAAAIRHGDAAGLVRASQEMAGLGQGLTPSGDDFLAGVYAALLFRGRSGLAAAFASQEIEAAAHAASRLTTGFSGFLMTNAAAGLVAKPLADWLDAVHRGDAPLAESLVERIAGLGHTSGLDCLAGMVLSIQVSMEGSSWTN